jgi:6-phosphofructo-2-kinase/fructose-2,6-biphosphatase 2
MYNLEGKIGGDAKLSDRGELYARKLPELVRQSAGVSSAVQSCSIRIY